MPKEEIIEGLKYATSKGDTLEKAMMSFFNAGYTKQEIEDAARFLVSPQITTTNVQNNKQSKGSGLQIPQRVSNYGTKPKGKAVTIILVILLIMLLGVLVGVFLFRDELANFLNNFIS